MKTLEINLVKDILPTGSPGCQLAFLLMEAGVPIRQKKLISETADDFEPMGKIECWQDERRPFVRHFRWFHDKQV